MEAEKEHDLVVAITACRECLKKKWPDKQFDAVSAELSDDETNWIITFKDETPDEYEVEYHRFTGRHGLIYYTTDGQWGPDVYVIPLSHRLGIE